MNRELVQLLEQVAREKGLPLKVIVEATVSAIELAARKRDRSKCDVEYDEATGTIHLYTLKDVVETVEDSKTEIALEDAQAIHPAAMVGDEIRIERDISELGRISAQKAKQIINQKVKEAEKQKVYDQYKDRSGEVVLAAVQRIENGLIADIGGTEAILSKRDQIPGEYYKRGDRFRALITEVKMMTSGKWPQIILSRTCDDFLMRLFEIEVPEISEGIVEIASVARDPGFRAKIGVRSLDKNVDPVGACVGMRGSRIQSIVRELRGEKIDIIEWSDDVGTLISRAMTPASVQNTVVYPDDQSVDVVVADDQLALAIGKRGQNAKLAVRLTGWKINITSETERLQAVQESFNKVFGEAVEAETDEEEVQPESLMAESPEIDQHDLALLADLAPDTIEALRIAEFNSIEEVAASSIATLADAAEIDEEFAEQILEMAQEFVEAHQSDVEQRNVPNSDPHKSEEVTDE